MSWTIEPHGKGYALYSGRDGMHHGLNLVYLSDPDGNWARTKAMIEAVPDMLSALEKVVEANEYSGTRLIGAEYDAMQAVKAAIKKAMGQ